MAQPGRRNTIKRAAVTVLAKHGPRGFTHRAVDSAAGLPAGSVNYYASSRDNLLVLACEEMLECDAAACQSHFNPTSPLTVDATLAYVETMSTGHGAACTIARHYLEGEASIHAKVAVTIAPRRERIALALHRQLAHTGTPVNNAAIAFFQIQLAGLLARQTLPYNGALSPDQVVDAVIRLIRSVTRDTHHTETSDRQTRPKQPTSVRQPPLRRR